MNNRAYLGLCILLGSMALQSCGFRLPQDYHLPDNIQQVSLASTEPHSLLLRALTKRFNNLGIVVAGAQATEDALANSEASQQVRLVLLSDTLDRRLLSLFSTGQVAEYQLVYSVHCELWLPQDDVPKLIAFDVNREYQDDPDAVLAKSRELELVLDEMRNQAADKIMRQMATMQALQNN